MDIELEELNLEDPEYYPECNGHVPNLTTNEDGRFVINWGQDFVTVTCLRREIPKTLVFVFNIFFIDRVY